MQFPVGVEPEGVAVSPDGAMVINTSETTSIAHLIDWSAKKIVANILAPPRPRFAEFKPDGSELWGQVEPVSLAVVASRTAVFLAAAIVAYDPARGMLMRRGGFRPCQRLYSAVTPAYGFTQ